MRKMKGVGGGRIIYYDDGVGNPIPLYLRILPETIFSSPLCRVGRVCLYSFLRSTNEIERQAPVLAIQLPFSPTVYVGLASWHEHFPLATRPRLLSRGRLTAGGLSIWTLGGRMRMADVYVLVSLCGISGLLSSRCLANTAKRKKSYARFVLLIAAGGQKRGRVPVFWYYGN